MRSILLRIVHSTQSAHHVSASFRYSGGRSHLSVPPHVSELAAGTWLGLVACTLFMSSLSHAQSRPSVPPPTPFDIPMLELKSSSERQLTMPDLNWYGNPQCDTKGNAYVHASADVNDGVVMKLDVSRDDAVIYQWKDKPRDMPFMEFSVSPAGDVAMLGQTNKGLWVVSFSSDGRESSRSRLDLAAQFWPLRFAVFPDGSFLLSGYYTEDAPNNLEGTAFTGIFEPSGQLRYRLPDKTEKVVPKEARRATNEASAIVGPDGNVYLLRPHKVEVVSPIGDIVRELPFSKLEPKAVATQLWIAGNRIALQFLTARTDGKFAPTFLVLDSSTAVPVGMYKPSQDLGFLLCFTGNGFLLDRPRQGRITLVKADLP
jgi:hypothetical protein